eukprot:scaffold138766_cov37-Cyclotella_meneghiniana.AAC.1
MVSSNLPDYFLVKKAENPFPVEYSPDDDVSPLLDPGEANYFMQLIGILRWMCEIGRLDICTETSMLSSYSAMPREGHLKAALHVFAYLRDHANTRLVFDPYTPEIPEDMFMECTWGPEYSGAEEMIPPDAPKPLGKSVLLRMFVDSDHAGNKVSRRSRTGYVIWANSSIVDWLSKKQATIEASVFKSPPQIDNVMRGASQVQIIFVTPASESHQNLKIRPNPLWRWTDEPAHGGPQQCFLGVPQLTVSFFVARPPPCYVAAGVSR